MRIGTLALGAVAAFLAMGASASAELVGVRNPDRSWSVIDTTQPKAERPVTYKQTITGDSLVFNLSYFDPSGTGFNSSSNGADRKAALETALMYIDSVIGNTGTIDIHVEQSQFDGGGALAFAGPRFLLTENGSLRQGFYGGAPHERLVDNPGVDPIPSEPDMTLQVDFGYDWYIGSQEPPDESLDLISVLTHELVHGMGLISVTTSNGSSSFSGSGANVYTLYDELLQTPGGQSIWGGSTPSLQVSQSTLTGGPGSIVFGGSAATQSFGSAPPIYTPSTFLNGVSISHWEDRTEQNGERAVMNPRFLRGNIFRLLLPFEVAALQDIGYTLAVDTEPSDDPAIVLNNLIEQHWMQVSINPPFTSPDFRTDGGGLGLFVPANADVTFGFWETREALQPLAAGLHKLTFAFDTALPGPGERQPEVRIRVFTEDNSYTDMAVTAQAGTSTLRNNVAVYLESDGATKWKIAVDLLGTEPAQVGGVTLTSITSSSVSKTHELPEVEHLWVDCCK